MYCSASDPGWSEGGGGARNMKYKGPLMAAIFFMTSFYRDGGAWPPWLPPGSAAAAFGSLRSMVVLWAFLVPSSC